MSDEDGSVGHPEQTLDSKSGAIIDAFFNLNPEKFGPMPAVEFLDRVRKYQRVNDEFEQAKKTLLELEEKKKQLEDEARNGSSSAEPEEPASVPVPVPVPVPPYNEHTDEQPAESTPEQHEEASQDQPTEHHEEQPPVESHDEQSPENHSTDQPAAESTDEYPQISKVTSDYI